MPLKKGTNKSKATNKDSTDGAVVSKKAGAKGSVKKKPVHSMPPPLPLGETLTDLNKKQWKLGSSVGKGGFGEIYMATPATKTSTSQQYVIKVEPHENGPLFTELSFYMRAAKSDSINNWIKSHKLKYLGVPAYISSGLHVSTDGTHYRFMVMERFGEDIEKIFCKAGRIFNIKTIETLEYLHESEYVHADVKGSNLLTGFSSDTRHQVYLVDYGLAYRYGPEDEHKDYKPDPKCCHDGTIEFTSVDAHDGAKPSRRGDMEILGYCLLQWACGKLPWESCLEDKPKVALMKNKYKSLPVTNLMKDCFKGKNVPKCLEKYMEQVYALSYKDKPHYENMKKLFIKELKDMKLKDDKEGLYWMEKRDGVKSSPQKRKLQEISPSNEDSQLSPPPVKKRKMAAKKAPKTTSSKESEEKLASSPLSPQETYQVKKLSPVKKLSSNKSQSKVTLSPSKKLPSRASKILAQKLIKDSVTSPPTKRLAAVNDQKEINVEEIEEITPEDTTTQKRAGTKRKSPPISSKNTTTQKRAGMKRKPNPPIGSDIIPGEEIKEITPEDTTTQKRAGTKRKNPPIGSDIIPGEEIKEITPEDTTTQKRAGMKRKPNPPIGSDIIPGEEIKEITPEDTTTQKRAGTKRKNPPIASNIIPGEEIKEITPEDTTTQKRAGTKRKNPPIGSDIIPGEEIKEITPEDTTTQKRAGTKRKNPPIGSDIIPGLDDLKETSSQKAKGTRSTTDKNGSDIIPGLEKDEVNGSGLSVIIPKGHYPHQLGYTSTTK